MLLWSILPKYMTFHLLALNIICHSSAQSNNLSRSSCSFTVSLSVEILPNILVLSANFSIQFLTPYSKSLMKIRNSNGPNTDLCGTPLRTASQSETIPLKQTLCFLPLSHSTTDASLRELERVAALLVDRQTDGGWMQKLLV